MLPMLLWTIACGTTEAPPPPPVDVAPDARGKDKKGGKHGGAKGEGLEATLVSLEAGDSACYVKLRESSGTETTYPGAPELCPGGGQDASALVGKMIRAKVGKQQIPADSCQGNPACQDKQTVDFVQMMKGI
jgi:hypothetical protein